MKKSRQIAYIATFIALIFVALLLDTAVGRVLPIQPAIFSLPAVFVFALTFGKWQYSALGGLVFGLLSFARAMMGLGLPEFQNPLVSILPRVFLGFVVFGAYLLGRVIFAKTKKKETLALGFAGFCGTLWNTITVVSMMNVINHTSLAGVFGAIISFNFPIEIVVATVLTPYITLGVRRGLHINVEKKRKENSDVTCD